MFGPSACIVAAALLGTPADAQDEARWIDELFTLATPEAPGCVVAVSRHGKLLVNLAYGSADLERDVPLSPSPVFDAGSVTKQFVAAAVLLLVEEGRLALSDDVREHLPELPDYGHVITVDHLLTRTSGLRDWTGIAMFAGDDVDALTLILRQRSLGFPPGEEWSYSNSGYVLLKELVARASGRSFSDFARERLLEPLGMEATAYSHDLREVVEDRALACEQEGGRWRLALLLDNDRGGGGALLSTAEDLVAWNDALASARLGVFVTGKLQELATLNNGRELGYGRGLFLDTNRGAREVWHTGSADGYRSWLGRYPEHDLSIAVLCNGGDGTDRTQLAHRIFDLLVPSADLPAPRAEEPPALAAGGGTGEPDLDRKTGLFFSDGTGEPLRLVVDDGRLRVAGGPALEAVAEDRFRRVGAVVFFRSQDRFELRFLSDDRFELRSMEGETTTWRRARFTRLGERTSGD